MPRVSLKQIAQKAGVSRMTVSCALRNSPRVKAETAARIQAIADELGYAPDPRIAEHMARVRDTKQKALLPIAWINANAQQNAFQKYEWLQPYIEGAQERCEELGYRLEEFWLRQPKMTAGRLSNIIEHRGINGIILTPTIPSITHLKLKWQAFSCVSIENAILAPRVHRVIPDGYYNILLALKVLKRRGYKRIGLCIHHLESRRSNHSYLAALQLSQADLNASSRVPPHIFKSFEMPAFKKWLRHYKPDAIICHHSRMLHWLNELGYKVPEDIGVVHLATDKDCHDWAGIWQNKHHIGAQAVEQLVSMIQKRRTGLPEHPHEILIQGTWHNGKTIAPPKEAR